MARDMFAELLEAEWEEAAGAAPGRVKDVPKPEIVATKEKKRHNLDVSALVEVEFGGSETEERRHPEGVRVTEAVYVDVAIRCADSVTNGHGMTSKYDIPESAEEYLRGYHAPPSGDGSLDPYEREKYGGLMGEVKRIVHKHHDGPGDYHSADIVEIESSSDNDEGFGKYRADMRIELTRDDAPDMSFYTYHGGGHHG